MAQGHTILCKGDITMRHEEFDNICQTLDPATDMRVKHIVLHQIGKIVACLPDECFEVELENGEHKTWSKNNVTLVH
jgi:translation initiation factor IF-1